MKQTVDITHQNPKKRRGPLSGSVLLSLTLAIGACSSNNAASETATATDTPAATTNGAPSSTGAGATGGSTTASTEAVTEPMPSASTATSDAEAYFDQLEASGFGGVVAVREGANITTRAFGIADRENEVPMDNETVFDIGSVTKQFTGAAILRLEMDGLLSVDDTLGKHVPGLPDDTAAITLHQLLTHTSGLPHGLGPDDEPISRSDFLALVGETPLISEPGDRFEYSNVGYALLAAVIEFETGEPYEAYLRTALFEPAGMLDTGYVLPDWDGHTIAVGYHNPSGDRFGRPNEQPWDVDGPYWHLLGNGGILSTAADMLRWDEAMNGDDLLDAAAKAKFFAPHVATSPSWGDTRYAYGWLIFPTAIGTPIIGHNGGNGVFYADFLRFVEQDVTVFIATNSSEDADGDIAFEVANHVLGIDLESMSDDDSGESESGGEIDTAERHCGFDELSIDSLDDHSGIDTLPDSASGRAAELLLALLADGDATARLDFATHHVTEELSGGDPVVIADDIASLRDDLADYEVVRIFGQDDHRFHLLMQGPGVNLVLSLDFDETDPERLACIAVSA